MAAIPNYGLSESIPAEFDQDYALDPLPRAVLRPNTYVLLDGEWNFALDLEDMGERDHWPLGHKYTETAYWPGSVENQMKGKGNDTPLDKVIAWYERNFPLPEVESNSGKIIFQLTFGACGYATQVWVNGFPLKTIEDELIHLGEYTSFSYELDMAILQPENRLTVRVEDTLDADIPRGKQESQVYKRGGIWYQTYSGPVRSVWLEAIERNRLRSRIGVISLVEDSLVRFNVTTRIHDPGTYKIILEVYLPNGENTRSLLATDTFTIPLEAGEKKQRLVLDFPGAKLWSPEYPQLYQLVAKLEDQEGSFSVIETNFGLRKIESRGCCVYLNNSPIYLDGILYQPGASSYEEITKHLYSIKKLGCNLVRIHIAGVDPRIYKLADRIGLLLWVEVPSPHRSSKTSRMNHHQELLRMLNLLETHPSIVIWSLYNEGWGAQDIAVNKEVQQYIIGLYEYMRINHPQFLVVDNDGWNHISCQGRLKSDLLTAHIYTNQLGDWNLLLDKIVKGEFDKVTFLPLVVGDPFFFRRQLPIIISEWGGFGFKDYGGPTKFKDREAMILAYKKELRKRPIAGDVYTQAIDVEEERNGVIEGKSGLLLVREMIFRSESENRFPSKQTELQEQVDVDVNSPPDFVI